MKKLSWPLVQRASVGMVCLGLTQIAQAVTENKQLEKLLRRIEQLEKLEPRMAELEQRLAQSEADNARLRKSASQRSSHSQAPGHARREGMAMAAQIPS